MVIDISTIADPVLVVAAHPDDIEVHCGGTVTLLRAAGISVSAVLCTSGNRGTDDPSVTMEELEQRREAEQQAAADVLGVPELRFLRHDDGDLQFDVATLREEVVGLIRELRPRTVITHDPYPGDGALDSCSIYPDHTTVGRVTFEAAFVCAPGPLFYPEQLNEALAPYKPERLLLTMSGHPDAFVDIGSVWETKLQALRHHRTQNRHTAENDAEMERIARENGDRAGCELAEAFRLLRPS